MCLFFLLTMYCGIRGARSPHPRPWYLGAVVACGLGMGSKEVMVVAPLVTLLYDRVFIAGSFRDLFRQRWELYVLLFATWGVLGALLATSRVEEQSVLVTGLTPWRYALTQFGVIVHYLRLSLWPHPLILDYTWPLAPTPASVAPWASVLVALVGATLWALRRRPWLGFLGAWFFLILSPTSSVVPLADVAFEHRMYLPLAAVVALVVIGGHELFRVMRRRLTAPDALWRWLEVGLLVMAVAALGYATLRRNDDYRSEFAIWSDTVAKRPTNPRAHMNLGLALLAQKRPTEASAHFSEALRLKPDFADAQNFVGQFLYGQGKPAEAIAHYSEAVRLKPGYADAHNNLGTALYSQGQVKDAIPHFAEALRLRPDFAEAHSNLGLSLYNQGKLAEAIAHYSEAVRLKPDHADAHNKLGAALATQGKLGEAITHFAEAVRLKPDFADALGNLQKAQELSPRVKDTP